MTEGSTQPSPSCAASDFRHRFAVLRQIAESSVERALFFDCAPLHALIVALIIDNPGATFFAPDRGLVARVATAHSIDEVHAAISEFRQDPANEGWLRRVGGVRISTRRLARIAARCFAAETASLQSK
jgi:hypothetical protein